MKSRWVIVLIVAVFVISGAMQPGTAQYQTEQRVSDLETRVAALETQVAVQDGSGQLSASPVPSGSPATSPLVSPIVPTGERGVTVDYTSVRFPVSGTAFGLLAPATLGEVSVVAFGLSSGGYYTTVILRNGTDAPIAGVQVGVEARDASGNLLGAGSTTIVEPPVIDPGALATADVSFDGAPVPADAVLKVSVPFEPGSDLDLNFYDDYAGVEVTELVVTDSSIIGTVTNSGSTTLSDVRLSIACFNDAGTLYALEVGVTTRATIEPGGSSAFSGVMLGDTSACASALITSAGTAVTS